MKVSGRHRYTWNGKATDNANAPYVYYVVQYRESETRAVEEWGRRYNIVRWESPEEGETISYSQLRYVWKNTWFTMRGRGWKWFYQANGFRTVKAYTRHPATESREGFLYSLARGGGD